jgi:beta-lactamase regulating signal transducer with metallopeptidase domain
MIAAWIAYGLVVSGILCVAGVFTERAARWIGVPTRWAWAAAIGLGWALPFLARSPANPVASPIDLVAPPAAPSGQAGANLVGQILAIPGELMGSLAETWGVLTAAGALFDLPLFVFWLGAASVLLSALAITYRRLGIRASSWPERDIEGHPVRISEDLGPAVLGVGRGQVVLPRWAVECPENHRRLIVLHEAEHLRAGDERLLFAAVIAVALMPWNLFAWWQLRRLRLAVELDCDRRVLGTGVQIREYASLLLEAGSRRGASPMTAAVFVHFHSQLGRRIREMTEKRKGPRYVPSALALMGALVLLVAACQTPVPTDPADLQEITAGKQVSHVDPADGAELHRILEEEDGLSLVIEEVDGDTYVVDALKVDQLREQGKAGFLLRKLKEHGDVKLTLIHEDGSETASFGTLVEAHGSESIELVEYQLRTDGELEFGPDQSTMKPRVQGELVRVKEVKATESEVKKTEGGSR